MRSFRRLYWLRRVALPVFLAAFLAVGIAHAAHIHGSDSARNFAASHCDLCLQSDRLAGIPAAITSPVWSAPWVSGCVAQPGIPDCAAAEPAHRARGPPRF